jgi:hypothetical protein
MIALRKSNRNLNGGAYRDLSACRPTVYGYLLGDDADALCVLLNFSDDASTFEMPAGRELGSVVIGNLSPLPRIAEGSVVLQPWESAIFTTRA